MAVMVWCRASTKNPNKGDRMPEKIVKQVIRIFQNGKAEILEGESLETFLRQEVTVRSLLRDHPWASREKEIHWVPIKKVLITKNPLNKGG